MRTVPPEIVHEIRDRLADTNPEEVQQLMDRMADEQPLILAYLMASQEQLGQGAQEGLLLVLGALIWESFSAIQSPLPQVAEDELDQAEETNIRMLETLAEDSEFGYLEAVEKMMTTYNQMPLFGVVLEELMSDFEDEPELADDYVGLAMIYLKTVIDCLDRRIVDS